MSTDDGRNVYTFDVENKLLSATNKTTNATSQYSYDAEGRRIKSLHGSSGQSSLYIYSGDQIVEERDSSGALLQHNVFGLGIDDLLVTNKGGIKYYPLTNDQSSVLALTDIGGNVLQRYDYDSFGNVTVLDSEGNVIPNGTQESFPLINTLFQGRELDLETGLYYFRARYYSPELGRFISHDPIAYKDSMNLYESFKNNPLKYVDPKGEFVSVIAWGAFALTTAYFGYESTKPNSALKEVVGDAVSAVKEKATEIKNNVVTASFIGGLTAMVLMADDVKDNDSSNVSGDKVAEDEVEDNSPEDKVDSEKNDGKPKKGYRYVGRSEAEVIEERGKVPNTDKEGKKKNVFYTPENAVEIGEEAKDKYQLDNVPTHRIELDISETTPNYAGNVEGSEKNIEMTTDEEIPAVKVEEIPATKEEMESKNAS